MCFGSAKMDFLIIWGDLLLPEGRFVMQDAWQVLLIGAAVLIAGRYFDKANKIEIPFPQRDLHLRSSAIDFVPRDHPDPE